MTEVVRITGPSGSIWAEVRCFQARHYVSSLPVHLRHWDAGAKVWKVDVSQVGKLTTDLRRAGYEVLSDTDAPELAADSWADHMFRELPRDLADAAYRALLRVLHPDTGGDNKPMAQLNAARDRAER